MNADNKKRHVISQENLPADIAAMFNEKYPKGFNDLLPDLVKYSPGINPRTGKQIDPFYAVTLETDTDIYLIKIKVDVDNPEDVERWLEGEDFKTNVEKDSDIMKYLTKEEIDECFDYKWFLRNVDMIFERFGL